MHLATSEIEQWPHHCPRFMKREKTMNRVKGLIAIMAFSLLVLCLPAIASAQWGNPNDPYGRNGGYNNGGNNNGQYGNYGDMRSIVRDLKGRSRELQKHLDRDLDNSRYDGSRREDELNDLARRFKNEVNGLSESNNNYGSGHRDNRVDRVLDLGSQLDRALSRTRLDYHVQELVNGIQSDLNALRNAYGYNNGRNNRNGNGGGGNSRNNRPSWWPF